MLFLETMKRTESRHCGWNALAAFISCTIVTGFALLIPDTTLAIRIVALTAYPVVCFIFPALFYLCAKRTKSPSILGRLLALALLFGMTCFILFGVHQLIAEQFQ